MKTYQDWQLQKKLDAFTENDSFKNCLKESLYLLEASSNSRYSVEVNYRSKIKEVLEAFAKICLGYVSAAMKQSGYHVKHVYDEKPLRILVSSRNWDDGEWVGIVYFHPDHDGGCFIVSKGFYNKDEKSVSMQSRNKCKGDSAAEIAADLRNLMHSLKGKPDRHVDKLKGIPLKRGPKK
ncbi:MAG: hypothetical protein DWQ19_11705 [Crenarchaeota archaeon]|nr:MAG: hypothetical protein DWQ19_11705 [Thermoproteota archaeon]